MAKKGKSANPTLTAANTIVEALQPLTEAERQAAVNAALTIVNMQPIGNLTARIVGTSQPSTASDSRNSTRNKSPGELIQEKKPATNPQFIALFAYYRDRYEGKSRFSPAMLMDYFSKVKEPKPKNFTRDFSKAVRSGWIHEDGDESYITSKGIEAVESGFDGKRISAPRKKKKAPKVAG